MHYPDAEFYLTISLDPYAFHTLMSQETDRNDWPFYDVELTRNNATEQLGISFAETMFLHQNEVAVHKIASNSLASNANVIKIFDILVTINGIKISTLKQALKIIQKSVNTIKFQFQRPVIKFKNENTPSKPIIAPKQAHSNLDSVSVNLKTSFLFFFILNQFSL